MGNVSSYSQLMDIAKNAYGSGVFEGTKGGNGYIGQYTDSNGKTHVVKVLTHREERKDYAEHKVRRFTQELAWATQELKSSLIALAGGEGTQLGNAIKKMLDDAQAQALGENMTAIDKDNRKVGLLSRKIVAQAVSAIAKSGTVRDANGVAFSWDAVNDGNRAATVKDTTVRTVDNLIADGSKGVGGAENVQVMKEVSNEYEALEKTSGHNWKTTFPKWGKKFGNIKMMAEGFLLGFRQAQAGKMSLRQKLLTNGCFAMQIKDDIYCALLMKLKGFEDGEKVLGNGKKVKEMTAYELLVSPGDKEKERRMDRMNARELLEELKDVLDCDESDMNLPLGQFQFVLGIRLALEKLASEDSSKTA